MIGAGSWGTTFGKVLADGGAHVVMWARRAELAQEIQEGHRNSEYLPGINLPRSMSATRNAGRRSLSIFGGVSIRTTSKRRLSFSPS